MSNDTSFDELSNRKQIEHLEEMEKKRDEREEFRSRELEEKKLAERRMVLEKAEEQRRRDHERAEATRLRRMMESMPQYVRVAPTTRDIQPTGIIQKLFGKNEKLDKSVRLRSELSTRVNSLREKTKDGLVVGVTRLPGHDDTGLSGAIAGSLSEDTKNDIEIHPAIIADMRDCLRENQAESLVNIMSGRASSYTTCIHAIERYGYVKNREEGPDTFTNRIRVFDQDGSDNTIKGIPPNVRVGDRDKTVRAIPDKLSVGFIETFSSRTPFVIDTTEEKTYSGFHSVLEAGVNHGLVDGIVVEISIREVNGDTYKDIENIVKKYDGTPMYFVLYMPEVTDLTKPIATRTAKDIVEAGIPKENVTYISKKINVARSDGITDTDRWLVRNVIDKFIGYTRKDADE